jgi:catechol 2,3-dioxygenase-like lactoylglutathione lyase family enzyme
VSEKPTNLRTSLVTELHVNDIDVSLSFWQDVLGFQVSYQRPEEKFVYLVQDDAEIMLCQRHGRYETGAMESPLGQGMMFQIYVDSIEPILAALSAMDWPLYEPLRDAWYRTGDQESGMRQFFIQDPDGYLILVAESLGERAIQAQS